MQIYYTNYKQAVAAHKASNLGLILKSWQNISKVFINIAWMKTTLINLNTTPTRNVIYGHRSFNDDILIMNID